MSIKSAKTSRKRKIEENEGPSLPEDIFRALIRTCADSSQIFALKNLSVKCQELVVDEIGRMSKKDPIKIDIHKFFLEENPFLHKFVWLQSEKGKQGKLFHQDVRKLCDMLEALLKISENYAIENLQSSSLGWIAENEETIMKRTPFMLQKRIVRILKQFKGDSLSYGYPFLRPSRFVRTFSHRFETIKELDLGNMRTLAVLKLRSEVFPALINLEKLTWHRANTSFLKKIVNKDKINKLILTEHPTGRPTYSHYLHLAEFENLEELYFGFTVPNPPTRMIMDILLNLYQSIWKKKVGNSNNNLLAHFEKLKRVGFWNAPENLFIDIAKRGVSLETVTFGMVSQDLKRMCSFDSVMQSLFKFEESEFAREPLNIQNLNLNLHTMPVVSLEYYLPNLMDRINKKFHTLKSVSLFINCIHSSEMPPNASWSLETKKEKMRQFVLHDSTYTDFSLTCLGNCGLLDLDRQLPSTLRSLSIFLSFSSDSALKFVNSVVKFVEKLGDINNFPDLEEFHIQIWGVRCLEKLVDVITENLGSFIKKLSIFALPRDDHESIGKNLIGKIARNCEKLESISFSSSFLSTLISKEKVETKSWKVHVKEICRKSGIDVSRCEVSVGKLPRDGSYYENPRAEAYPEEDDDFEEEYGNNQSKHQSYEKDSDSDDSMFVSGEEEDNLEKSMDELDLLEMKLEKESTKRHEKWEKRRKNRSGSTSEEEKEEQVDEDIEDVIDFENMEDEEEESIIIVNRKNRFFDDEADESDGDESDIEDEEEVENEEEEYLDQVVEDNIDQEDERLINEDEDGRKNRAQERKEEAKKLSAKRRKVIIVSDDDEEEN